MLSKRGSMNYWLPAYKPALLAEQLMLLILLQAVLYLVTSIG